MNSNNLKLRLKELLFALFAVIGIFSFAGLEIGSPNRILNSTSIELLFSKKKEDGSIFKSNKANKSSNNSFLKKETFKHLSFQKNRLDKVEFIQFSKQEIQNRFFIKKVLILYASKSSEDSPFASIQG